MKSRKFRHTYSALAAAAVLATTAAAWAASDDHRDGRMAANDALAIGGAKVSLTQAIAAAEQQTGGKASRAEYERTRDGWVYAVEVVNGTDVLDVRVDANAGTVISSAADQADRGDEDDDDRDEGNEREHEQRHEKKD